MRLNTLKPAAGSKPEGKRRGRGESSGLGKTFGRGQKGQKADRAAITRPVSKVVRCRCSAGCQRSALHRDQPNSATKFACMNRSLGVDVVDMAALVKGKLISQRIQKVKIIESGKLGKAVTVKGLKVTKGARAAIEAAGGKVED